MNNLNKFVLVLLLLSGLMGLICSIIVYFKSHEVMYNLIFACTIIVIGCFYELIKRKSNENN